MFHFREELKKYLEDCFSKDGSLTPSKKPKVYNGYQVGHEPSAKTPEIQIQPLNNSEQREFTTFCGKNANSVPIQIAVYTGQLKIGGVDYNAQDGSTLLGEKVEKYIYEYIYSLKNEQLYNGYLVDSSPELPMNDGGTIYTNILRFDFIIAYPYEVG